MYVIINLHGCSATRQLDFHGFKSYDGSDTYLTLPYRNSSYCKLHKPYHALKQPPVYTIRRFRVSLHITFMVSRVFQRHRFLQIQPVLAQQFN